MQYILTSTLFVFDILNVKKETLTSKIASTKSDNLKGKTNQNRRRCRNFFFVSFVQWNAPSTYISRYFSFVSFVLL